MGQPLLGTGDQNLSETVCLFVCHEGSFPVGPEDIDRFPLALPDEGSGSRDGGVEDHNLGGSEGVVVHGRERGDGIGTRGLLRFAIWREGGVVVVVISER